MKNFELRDSEGNVLAKLPENARILEVEVFSSNGEKARIKVGDVDHLGFRFITTGSLVPNLLDEEDARREQERKFAHANSPSVPSESDEEAAREGTPESFDFVLTHDQTDIKSQKDFMDAISPAGPEESTNVDPEDQSSASTPNSELTKSNNNADTSDETVTNDEPSGANPGDSQDANRLKDAKSPKENEKSNNGDSTPPGLNL